MQEEILFLIYPEMILSMLVFDALKNNQAILFKGVRRYSRYTGYASSFKYDGEYKNSRSNSIVAIDAIPFKSMCTFYEQLKPLYLNRELNKAYAGFVDPEMIGCGVCENLPVATGNWGCGCFGGNVQVKVFIF